MKTVKIVKLANNCYELIVNKESIDVFKSNELAYLYYWEYLSGDSLNTERYVNEGIYNTGMCNKGNR